MKATGNLSKNKKLNIRKIPVDAIQGTEILAQDIVSDSGTVLIPAGIIVKQEYSKRLKALNIDYILVEDELSEGVNSDPIIEMQIRDECKETVKETIEKYFYSGNAELEKLKDVADEIIYDVLEEPEVMFNITGIRRKSEDAYSHSVNVSAMSVLMAIKLNLPKNKIRDIAVGSLLHDIGLKYIPFDCKNLKYESLTPKEIKEIKKHVIFGYSAVENEDWLSSVAKDIILSHHETLDGNGYPFHYTGEKIKIGSKIVGVCDEFDRLVYGIFTEPMKIHKAIEYIISQAGIKYDFKVVNIFNESVAAYPNGTIVITNGGERAVVLRQNTKCPTRPVIRMIYDKYGNKYTEWVEKDLTKELTLFICDTEEI